MRSALEDVLGDTSYKERRELYERLKREFEKERQDLYERLKREWQDEEE